MFGMNWSEKGVKALILSTQTNRIRKREIDKALTDVRVDWGDIRRHHKLLFERVKVRGSNCLPIVMRHQGWSLMIIPAHTILGSEAISRIVVVWLIMLDSVGTSSRTTNTILKLRMDDLLMWIPLVEIVIREPDWGRSSAIVWLIKLRAHTGRILRLIQLHLLRMDEPSLHILMILCESLLLTRIISVGVFFSLHHHSRVPLGMKHYVLARKRLVCGQGTWKTSRTSLVKEDTIVLSVWNFIVQWMVALIETLIIWRLVLLQLLFYLLSFLTRHELLCVLVRVG